MAGLMGFFKTEQEQRNLREGQEQAGDGARPMNYIKTEPHDPRQAPLEPQQGDLRPQVTPQWQQYGLQQGAPRAPLAPWPGIPGDVREQIAPNRPGSCAGTGVQSEMGGRLTNPAEFVGSATGALATGAAQTNGVLKVAPYKKAFAVQGNTMAHRQLLKDLGGRWNRPLAAWVYPGPKQEAVVSALRVAGVAVDVSSRPLESAPPQPTATAPERTPNRAADAVPAAQPGTRHTLSVERYKKALLVKGDTRHVKETLKRLGGKWSGPLGGFIFGGKMKTTQRLLSSLRADSAVTLCVADGVEAPAPERSADLPEAAPQVAAAGHPRPSMDELQAGQPKRTKLEQPPEPVEEWITPNDPHKPKQPLSAFFLFSKAKRAQVVSERPEMASQVAEVARLAGAEWKTMDQTERAPYVAMAVRLQCPAALYM